MSADRFLGGGGQEFRDNSGPTWHSRLTMAGMDRIGLKRMHHVSFAVADLAASKQFFCEVLGLPEDERPAFRFPGAWLAVGDRQIHLIEESNAGREVRGRISRSDHLAMEVEDLEVVKRRLAECGIDFVLGGNQSLGMSQAFCSDPDGHTIEFVQYHR